MNYNKLFIIFSAFLLVNCGGGISDFKINLDDHIWYINGGGYNYIYSSKESEGKSIDSILVFPDVEKYNFDNKYIIARQKPNQKSITKIFNNKYVDPLYNRFFLMDSLSRKKANFRDKRLTKRDSFLLEEMIKAKLSNKNTIKDQDFVFNLADSIVKNNKKIQFLTKNSINYYIIEKKSKKVFGPLNKSEYQKKRKELNVSNDLKIVENE